MVALETNAKRLLCRGDDAVELGDAQEMVEQAHAFVAAMRVAFMPEERSNDGDGVARHVSRTLRRRSSFLRDPVAPDQGRARRDDVALRQRQPCDSPPKQRHGAAQRAINGGAT